MSHVQLVDLIYSLHPWFPNAPEDVFKSDVHATNGYLKGPFVIKHSPAPFLLEATNNFSLLPDMDTEGTNWHSLPAQSGGVCLDAAVGSDSFKTRILMILAMSPSHSYEDAELFKKLGQNPFVSSVGSLHLFLQSHVVTNTHPLWHIARGMACNNAFNTTFTHDCIASPRSPSNLRFVTDWRDRMGFSTF